MNKILDMKMDENLKPTEIRVQNDKTDEIIIVGLKEVISGIFRNIYIAKNSLMRY